jgi:ABC-2 type transport system permease protein
MVLIQAFIFTGAAWFFGFRPDPLGFVLTLIVLTLTTVIFASYSYAIALKFQSEEALAPLVQVATLPILLLAGFLLPMDLAPTWLRTASHFDPVYYSIEASRDLMNGHFNRPSLWQVFAVNGLLAAIILWWAVRLVRNTIR